MSGPSIHVVVQSCQARQNTTLPWIRKKLEQSDIGTDYEVMVDPGPSRQPQNAVPFSSLVPAVRTKKPGGQPPLHVREHFYSVIQRLYDSGADYGLRLEDDVLVNRHILHNIRTWPALDEPRFGAGWLLAPKAALAHRSFIGHGSKTGTPFRRHRDMFCALAVLLPRPLLKHIVDAGLPTTMQDFTMSRAVWDRDERCFFHVPSLAENCLTIESARGHRQSEANHCARDLYAPMFRRRV